jgi:hypothetical protein
MLVIIKTMTVPVVSLVMKADEPELPNTVWLDPLPKAAPISEPRPVCKRTIHIKPMDDNT